VWAYLLMSAVTFVVYSLDKSRARGRGRRVPEAWLHLLALAWGWPGGLAAQLLVRHKTRKLPFLVVFWLIVAGHVLWWLWVWGWVRF
jgi:uncharacterized membrane protein YsdA (DUF1294 family)